MKKSETKRNLIIVDLRYKKRESIFTQLKKIADKDDSILCLTPYAAYLIETLGLKYKTFSDVISNADFLDQVKSKYIEIESFFKTNSDFRPVFVDISRIITYQFYTKNIAEYINLFKKDGYKVLYVTDVSSKSYSLSGILNNDASALNEFDEIDTFLRILEKNDGFYAKHKKLSSFKKIINYRFNIDKLIRRFKKSDLKYDNVLLRDFFEKLRPISIEKNDIVLRVKNFIIDFTSNFLNQDLKPYIEKLFTDFFNQLIKDSESINYTNHKIQPFTFLANNKDYLLNILYKKNNIPRIFMQHGSYYHENYFLKFCEILPADINFVLNGYTRELFNKRLATNTVMINSLNLNRKITNRKKKWDFIYITDNTYYSYPAQTIHLLDSPSSIDGFHIYKRHESVINLFGKNLKEKKLCIKLQPGIIGSQMYVPLLELSKNYNNIKIEFTTPLHSLIEKSNHIISDYFSTEFINRNIHKNKKIILFNMIPMKIPNDTVGDMKKLFILCNSESELYNLVTNIDSYHNDKLVNLSLIEYYSSKDADTKQILDKNLSEAFDIYKRSINA